MTGKAKEGMGSLTGNTQQQQEGKAQNAVGKATNAVGDTMNSAKEAVTGKK